MTKIINIVETQVHGDPFVEKTIKGGGAYGSRLALARKNKKY
jgi:hypothetical protein